MVTDPSCHNYRVGRTLVAMVTDSCYHACKPVTMDTDSSYHGYRPEGVTMVTDRPEVVTIVTDIPEGVTMVEDQREL